MKKPILNGLNAMAAAIVVGLCLVVGSGDAIAQADQTEASGTLLDRILKRSRENSKAEEEAREATRKFQEANSSSKKEEGKPEAMPEERSEPVARERTASEPPKAAPVATPVATRPPSAVAEPVAREVPGSEPAPKPETAKPVTATATPIPIPVTATPVTATPVATIAAEDTADSAEKSIEALADGDVPAPADLKPKFNKAAPPSDQGPMMEITSDESILHNAPDEERMVEFTGDVFLDHPGFNMASDRLEVYLNDEEVDNAPAKEGEKKPPFKRAIASGSMIKIVRINPDGETETAFARQADFDGITGDVILSGGPPQLQSGKIHVKPTGTEDKIHLLASGTYKVETKPVPSTGADGRALLVIPIGNGGDSQTKSPTFLPTNLNDVKTER